MSDRGARLVGLYAVIAAAAAFVLAPLLAPSYFATDEGAGGARHRDRVGVGGPGS